MVFDLSILSYVIPVVSIFITYILGTFSSKKTRKLEVEKMRYETFYVPFMRHLLGGLPLMSEPHSFSAEARATFFDLIMKNTYLLGAQEASLVPKYYESFSEMFEYEEGNLEYSDAPQKYDEAFTQFCLASLLEAQKLSKLLKYPNLSKTISRVLDF